MKRSADLARELSSPQRALAPLRALGLPRDLVRRGLAWAWEVGRHLAQDALGLLARLPSALLRPTPTATRESAKPSTPKPAPPKPGSDRGPGGRFRR